MQYAADFLRKVKALIGETVDRCSLRKRPSEPVTVNKNYGLMISLFLLAIIIFFISINSARLQQTLTISYKRISSHRKTIRSCRSNLSVA